MQCIDQVKTLISTQTHEKEVLLLSLIVGRGIANLEALSSGQVVAIFSLAQMEIGEKEGADQSNIGTLTLPDKHYQKHHELGAIWEDGILNH